MKLGILLFIILFINGFMLADNKPGSLTGLVIDDETQEVIVSAIVLLKNLETSIIYKTESELSGKYTFVNLPQGQYELIVTRIGFDEYSTEIMLEPAEQKILNLYIKPARIETDKINVTATRTEQTLQKTPSSIFLITSDDIKSKNKITLFSTKKSI